MKKMKKLIALASCMVLGASACASLAGCGGKGSDYLEVVVLSAGYGDEWIEDIRAKFEEETGIKVHLTAEYDVRPIISSHMASKKNDDDLYIATDTAWKTYAAQKKFAPLDNLLDDTVDGVKVSDKIRDEYSDSIWYTDQKNTKACYRLPWTSGTGGIFYNKKMFETNGWKVPTTYDELAALCATINSAALPVEGGDLGATVKPFVFTGQNADYFDYTVYTWWAQLAGKDAIEEFLEYKDASAFATKGSDGSALDNTYSKLKTATDYWNRLMTKENYVEGSAGKSNHLAQQNFVNGYAAMMFNGDWLYNEILGYKANEVDMTNFELGIMNTPALPGATYTDISYVIGEDQYIAIPASSDRIDQAKQFIKYVISDDGVSTFFNKAHGQLAYKTSAALTTEDGFMKNLLDFRTAAPKTFTNFSDSLLYLSNIVDIWSIASLRPYNALIGGTNTLDQAFESIQTQTASNWETWKRNAGIA